MKVLERAIGLMLVLALVATACNGSSSEIVDDPVSPTRIPPS